MCDPLPQMKLSQFNIVARPESGQVLLSNTLTGAVALISRLDYQKVQASLRQKDESPEVVKLIAEMRSGGFLVPQGLDESERAAYLTNSAIYRTDRLDLRMLPTEQCNLRCAAGSKNRSMSRRTDMRQLIAVPRVAEKGGTHA